MKLELFDFQREDVDEFIRGGHKSGLFAYDMALGKTLTATTLAVEVGTGVNLVVAPQVTFDGWQKAVNTQTEGQHELRWIKRATKAGQKAWQDYVDGVPGWYFITWQLMRTGIIFETRADMVIGDEIHEIQNDKGSAQNILMDTIESEYKIGLSGTAAGNKMSGIYGVISWLWPTKFKAYWPWLKKHFLLAGSGYQLTPIRERRPGSVTSELPFYVRRLKDDHFDEIVPKPLKPKEIFVDLNEEQRRIYDDFEATSGAWLDEEDESAGFVYSQYSIVKAGRLREIAIGTPVMVPSEDEEGFDLKFPLDTKSSKLDALVRILQENDGTFVVYTHSKKFINVAVQRLEALGISARAFTGDLNYKQKRKAIDELGDKYRVMIATQSSVGTGTDGLQHKSHKLVIISRDVKVSVNTQARDRLYRPGQMHPIETWEIVARNTNDEHTNDHLDYSEEVVNNMLNAERKGKK